MSLLIQPLMRLVSGGAVLLILLGTVLIPFDDLADPLWPRGCRICQSVFCLHFFHAHIAAAPTHTLRQPRLVFGRGLVASNWIINANKETIS